MKNAKWMTLLTIIVISISSIFVIYRFTTKDQKTSAEIKYINYVALGDSVAEGMNPYGEVGYSYADYLSAYFKEKGRLVFYTKGFSKSGYRIHNVVNDINNNRIITVDGKELYITAALREANLVTISIGANDFLGGYLSFDFGTLASGLSVDAMKAKVDGISQDLEDLILLIKKYAKEDIVLVGYYNPLPSIKKYKTQLNEVIKYSNSLYKRLAQKHDLIYVDIFELMQNDDYLPNPMDIHPGLKGHEAISKQILKVLENRD